MYQRPFTCFQKMGNVFARDTTEETYSSCPHCAERQMTSITGSDTQHGIDSHQMEKWDVVIEQMRSLQLYS